MLSRPLHLVSRFLLSVFILSPTLYGQTQTEPSQLKDTPQASGISMSAMASPETTREGAIDLKDIGASIIPPTGWGVKTNEAGLSLIMEEPRPTFSTPDKEESIYQRNITLAVKYEGSPIDEQRAQKLTKDLEQHFSHGVANNFRVIEHQFIDYRGSKDGLVLYSAMDINGHPMMQMHFLVSSNDKQYLMTFTDFEKRFLEDKAMMQNVWNSLTSLDIQGSAPSRYRDIEYYGGGAASFLLLLLIFKIMRQRRFKKSLNEYESEGDLISTYEDFPSSYNPTPKEVKEEVVESMVGVYASTPDEVELPITDVESLINSYEVAYFKNETQAEKYLDQHESLDLPPLTPGARTLNSNSTPDTSSDSSENSTKKYWFSKKSKFREKEESFAFDSNQDSLPYSDSIMSFM